MTEPITHHQVIAAEPGSRLEQLAEAYPSARAAADEAEARLRAITDGIKYELTHAAPGAERVDLHATCLPVPLRCQTKTKWSLDSKKLKECEPEVYVRYAKQTSYWELRAVSNRGAQ